MLMSILTKVYCKLIRCCKLDFSCCNPSVSSAVIAVFAIFKFGFIIIEAYSSLGWKEPVIKYNPLRWAGSSSTRTSCSEPCPSWPWMFPGHLSPLWAICDYLSCDRRYWWPFSAHSGCQSVAGSDHFSQWWTVITEKQRALTSECKLLLLHSSSPAGYSLCRLLFWGKEMQKAVTASCQLQVHN